MDVPQKHKGKKRVVTIYGIVALLIVVAFLLTLSTSNAALTMAKKSKLANETEQVKAAVAGYYTEYSLYPTTSDNATLINILTGVTADGNMRRIQFLTIKPSDLNARDEMLDPWGMPIQLSVAADGTIHMRSAGPDKIFGTPDDINN